MDKVCLGKVVRLHGYLGQMKIATSYDKDFNISKIEKIFDEMGNEFKVTKIFKVKDGVVVGMENVGLEPAKKYIGKNLYIDREIVSDKILIEDLKGSSVYFEDDELVGKITDVQDYGSAEVFYMNNNSGKEILFPNVKGLVVKFNLEEKKLVLNKDRFKEVANEN